MKDRKMATYEISGDFIFLFPLGEENAKRNSWELINLFTDVVRIALKDACLDVKKVNIRTVEKEKSGK